MNPLNVLRALLAELVEWFERATGPTAHVSRHRKSRDGERPCRLRYVAAESVWELDEVDPPTEPVPSLAPQEPVMVGEPEPPTIPALHCVQPDIEPTGEMRLNDMTGVIDWSTRRFRLHALPDPEPDEFVDTRGLVVPEFCRRHGPTQEPPLLTLASMAVAS